MNISRKLLKAVSPYSHSSFLNFKTAPFEAWKHNGGNVAMACYPPRFLHGAAFRWELPAVWKNRMEAGFQRIDDFQPLARHIAHRIVRVMESFSTTLPRHVSWSWLQVMPSRHIHYAPSPGYGANEWYLAQIGP